MTEREFTRICKALADPRRLEIFTLIARKGEISCGEIAERFPIGQPTVSHHLKLLLDAGLVDVRREGQFGFFSPRLDVFEKYLRQLEKRILGRERVLVK